MVDRVRMFEPVSVPRAADVVVTQLTRAIQLGRFLPGDQLPAEREFAVQLGVSRVTLRTALGKLEAGGLLERVQQGSGGGALAIAAGMGPETNADLRAQREALVEIYEFRVACEAAAAELAAQRRTEAQIDRLDGAIEALSEELTAAEFRAADNDFHLTVADAAGNRRLRAAVEDARAAMFGPLDAVGFELVVASTVAHHSRIRDAIANGDGQRAREAIIAHIRDAQQELFAAIAVGDERPSNRSN